MSTQIFQLTAEDEDKLSELVNIGVSHASTRLSQMLKRRVVINIPDVAIKNATNAADFGDKTSKVTLAVLLRISGAVEGYVFLLFPHEAAVHLLHAVSGKTVGDLRALNAFDRSMFQEIGNVVAGGMLSGLSQFLHLRLMQSVPEVVIDMDGAMFNSLAATMIAQHEEFLSLDVAVCIDVPAPAIICEDDKQVTGRMFFFLGPRATKQVLGILREVEGAPNV